MPSFILESLKPPLSDKLKNKRIFSTKNQFNARVKNTGWTNYYEELPFDTDVKSGETLNYFLSQYKQFGTEKCQCYSTATNDMLNQCKLKENYKVHIPKKLLNYYSYNDRTACQDFESSKLPVFPEICAAHYETTAQASYKLPYPILINRLSAKSVPFLRHRKFKDYSDPESNMLSDKKFYDEDFDENTKKMQKCKALKYISLNPYTGIYTDGSVPEDQ